MPGRQGKCRCRQTPRNGGKKRNRADLGRREAEADRRRRRHQRHREDSLQWGYHKATGKSAVDADKHRMFILDMCSPGLRTHLRCRKTTDVEPGVLRIEIADYLRETLAQSKGGRLATFEGAPGTPSPEANEDEGWEAVELDPR